ncbi:NAD-dependent succinate-semialdehyde dehydrogenase [Bradyrhizobium diazoefficiens]|nr:NAD-dependent succinate-semialdehyde dehydrogenase [Bradyrhizobium diazoefficiens]MBR0966366.1 NAD-dependent succinate-semialdehyde dehydrogenase [Bradyrhizobium diazoefficiens]MBR0979836.1 NAD-dependent succinate-semialdehyde dehydrogenase [Bradyrhizobium diazoefficiens]MBR1009184.1 NAD-dependent succinate-semialdehyde dehydrogenase [Bradyrhizobium diazoefficiens]MBR1012435.1 NAD-dependent succinate-semialdehyde dehydrogenase [Bradyrhizobium diazoefficiens]MBR1051191.1 NAD-dependent succin
MTDYPPLALFIDGQWRAADGRDVVPVRNPATGAVIGELPCAGIDDINEALASAARGHEQWRRMSAVDRGRILQQAAALILERRERIAGLITLALGKPIAEARAEVETAAGLFVWNAEEGRRAYGRVIPSRQPGVQQIAIPEPLGPIAAFAPWNAPAITPARKISSALAAGCSVIIKPAEETPATALAIAAALVDAGLPSGALNVLFGNPALISQTLLQSPVIRGLTFTGSTEVGKQLGALAAQTLKRSTLELGGHAPVLIFGDVDPEAAAVSAATAKFRNAGQVCTSPTRFFVHESIHDRFAAKLSELAEAIVVGDGFDAATRMGPLAHARRVESMERFVEDARQRRIRVSAGGRRCGNQGYFYRPTVLSHVDQDCLASNVEPFGPLAVTAPFGTRDEAIRLANRLPFGLASYVLTHDMRNAAAVSEAIQCGNVIVNHWQASLPETPFGGHKDSGIGSEGGIEGLREFQTLKYVSQLSL